MKKKRSVLFSCLLLNAKKSHSIRINKCTDRKSRNVLYVTIRVLFLFVLNKNFLVQKYYSGEGLHNVQMSWSSFKVLEVR